MVIGCDVSDGSKMAIVNKANQCIPHINISIHIENLNAKPFYRIEIPSSKNKPHCTQKGIYKVHIQQATRQTGKIEGVTALPGITDVGFRIESTE